jgi:hypothetical protein
VTMATFPINVLRLVVSWLMVPSNTVRDGLDRLTTYPAENGSKGLTLHETKEGNKWERNHLDSRAHLICQGSV